MKKTVLVYGLISGLISGGMLWISMWYMDSKDIPDFDGSMWLGYASMLLAFLLIYFAQASYRDNIGGGHITYGKAFQIGLLVTLISSIFYVVSWMVIYAYMVPDFMDKYQAYELRKLELSGTSPAVIAEKKKTMTAMMESYKNPIYRVAFTFLEIFPVGLIVSLISSFIVRIKNKKVQAA